MRIKFKKGKQREFIKKVLDNGNFPSLRSLRERGIDINYSTMKNYFSESRLLPKELFDDLCVLGNINLRNLDIEFLEDNWGKVKGGRNKSKN